MSTRTSVLRKHGSVTIVLTKFAFGVTQNTQSNTTMTSILTFTILTEALKMNLKNEMTVYKIRDNDTGLFSTGGVVPTWAKTGKTWPSRGALKSHLTQYKNPGMGEWKDGGYVAIKREVPESWEVVEFVFKLDESNKFSAREEANRPAKK